MAHMGLLWCPRQTAAASEPRGRRSRGVPAGAAGRHRGPGGCARIGRLMRKLTRQSKGLCPCPAARPAGALRCQYDPLSYALNFDGHGFGDDASHCSFSSRFVCAPSFECSAAAAAAAASTHRLAAPATS